MTNLQNQSGRSMIEMLGVLAIIGVLSVGGIAGYSKAMLKYKTNKTIDEVTMLVTNIRTLYAQQKDFTGVDAAAADNGATTLFSLGVVPDEMYDATKKRLVNAFAGDVIVKKTGSHTASDGRAFEVIVNGLPKEACMNIAVSDWGSNYSAGLIAMKVAGEDQAAQALDAALVGSCTTGSGQTCGDRPLTVGEASTACACGATGNVCSIAFKYN
jgi:Tfp pilus assembly protein FimT